jgi:hypothetical protein
VAFTTLLPRVTGNPCRADAGTRLYHRAAADTNFIDARLLLEDQTGTPTDWRVDLGGACTSDGIHPAYIIGWPWASTGLASYLTPIIP